ncbi:hypothetical protein PAXRUDRAFT_220227 [Paxillus rubicundulus Ve08.2h10]|uniref:PWWP domain-containing protein n=1 Tax=Paxillus rubicundulus Ve08.2h10 TaxID=930991 RepID=A0A0D0DTW9_9AGAM|nr:hypothetical protein PAXRUDRAFT_220227 [Paxillus rubicundulus Ve08.2h10]
MAGTQGNMLAERILPTRDAAERASASFAEQLMSSPTRSEGEHSEFDSSGSSNPFGEPSSHRTKAVKYRYSATGKHRSSPLKGISTSPERKTIDKPKSRVKPKPRPKPKPLPAPAPSASAKGKAKAPDVVPSSRKRKASVSSLCREETLSSLSALSPSPLSSVPTTPIVLMKELPPSSTPTIRGTTPDPPKRLLRTKVASLRSLGPSVSKVSVLSQPLSTQRKKKVNMSRNNTDLDTWDVGSSVWVHISESGMFINDNVQSKNEHDVFEEYMWWPAQIVQKQPLRVSLFGDFPSSSSSSSTRGLCTILSPSLANIQSIYNDMGSKRFTCATFRITSSTLADSLTSPHARKKQRLDPSASTSLEDRWESAVQSMEKASTLERDGLPALISSYASAGGSFYDSLDDSDPDMSDLRPSLCKPTKPTGVATSTLKPADSAKSLKSQRSKANPKSNLKGDASTSTLRDWSPCPPDPTLQIPGELVLAQAPRAGGAYWPAQLIAHVRDRRERYRFKFLDDEEYVIGRDKFWTSEEEGFVCCPLGQWESAVKTTDDPESEDESADYEGDDVEDPGADAGALPPPPPAKYFEDLSVRKQLAYVKPVLRAILNKEYAPAIEKHEGFMKGGSARTALMKAAGVRGGMDARFVKAVQRVICKWVLGEGGGRSERKDIEDVGTGSGKEAEQVNEVVDGAIFNPSESVPVESMAGESMENDKMESIEGGVVPETTQVDLQDSARNEVPDPMTPLNDIDTEDSEMVVDDPEQPHAASLPRTNSADLGSTSAEQAPSGLTGQLDLLAEVSQAVATEPSLLPSHPELSKIKVPDVLPKDTSPQPSPLTPAPDEEQEPPPRRSGQVGCEEFESLSGIEKLDYCLNILLPESIQQLLLWRSGERTSSALLSPEEEQRLHVVGVRKAAETDWVDDVMRLRVAQARLWGIDLSKAPQEEKAEVVPGGTRTRPRRATVPRPW